MSSCTVDWSDLSVDILCEIFGRLTTVSDRNNARSVCRSWNRVAELYPKLFQLPQTPCLMIPSPNHDSHHKMYDILNKKHYEVHLPDMKPAISLVVGTSKDGWIVYVDELLELHCFNLMTNKKMCLPSFTTLPGEIMYIERDDESKIIGYTVSSYRHRVNTYSLEELMRFYFSRAVVVSRPDDKPIVFVAFSDKISVAFAREGDECWTPTWHEYPFYDMIVYKEVLHIATQLGPTVILDIPPLSRTQHETDIMFHNSSSGRRTKYCCYPGAPYFFEMDGELWQLWRESDNAPHEGDVTRWLYHPNDIGITVGVIVLKLDIENEMWVEMESIGDHAVFLGNNYPVVVSTKDFPELKKDCVYFTDHVDLIRYRTLVHDVGVFDLKEKTFTPFCEREKQQSPFGPPPCWVWMLPRYNLN